MASEQADTKTPKAAESSLAPSAKMDTNTVSPPGAEEPPATSNPSTKPKAGLSPERIRPQDTGLKIEYCHPEPDEVEYDIVAVHGIGAHPTTAWQHRKTKANWLKNPAMLPAELPKARIMTYGYESYWFGENAVRTSIDGVARMFLKDLRFQRKRCRDRPLLLVGHFFGGLVMQKAYMLAGVFRDDYPGILDSITGMVFLGTPHKGVRNSSGPLTLSQVYCAVVAAEVQVEDNVLYSMSQDNDVFEETVHNFTRAVGNLRDKAPQLFCFYESKKTNTGLIAGLQNIHLEFVATESSATLSGSDKCPLALDHFNLNKFEDPEDAGYKAVMSTIVEMADASKDIIRLRDLDKAPATSMISKDTNQYHRPSLAAPIAKEEHFADRGGVLETVEDRFRDTFLVVLRGDSGHGKTHIAVEYAHRFHHKHPGSHVHWVNAACPIQFERSYARIADNLHLSKAEIKISGVLATVRNFLREDVGGQWLMVLDGLEDMELVGSTGASAGSRLLDYLPKSLARAQILVTTRVTAVASVLTKGRAECAITVGQLTDEDASFLLLGGVTTNIDKKEASIKTAKKLGRSAGTLTLAHLYRKRTRVNWSDYLRKMGLERELLKSNSEQLPQRAWQLIFKLLQKQNMDAAELLLTVASLDVQTVSSAFFNRNEMSNLIPLLVDYGMIEPSADRRLVNLTPLIRRCVQAWLRETEDKYKQEAKTLSLMVHIFDEDDPDTSSHILPCALAAIEFRPTAEGKTHLATLLWKVAHYYIRHGEHKSAQGCLEQCLKLREDGPPSSDNQIQETRRALEETKQRAHEISKDLAKTAKAEVDANPVVMAETHLRHFEKVQGGDHVDTIRKASDLAKLDLMHGEKTKSSQAMVQYKRVLDWCTKHRGRDHLDTARQQHNLALAYEASGDHERAAKLYLQAAQTTERSLGPDSGEQLRILCNMACMYAEQGRADEAQKAFEMTLRGQQKLLGFDHPETMVTRQNMAIFLGNSGQVEAAGKLLQEILILQVDLLGQEHPDTLSTACSLALNLRLRKWYKDSAKMFNSTWEMQSKVLGKPHRSTLKTKAMLDELIRESPPSNKVATDVNAFVNE